MIRKYAIIGSSCSGKSTLTYSLVGRLKKSGIRAEGVVSTDRKFNYTHEQLIQSEDVQCNIIFNQLANESYWSARKDVDVLILDRSPVDLICYYHASFPEQSKKFECMTALALEWQKQYTRIFYVPTLPREEDGKRPDEKFIKEADDLIRLWVKNYWADNYATLEDIPLEQREDYIYDRIS